ncbi:glycosyltransferase family protein [Thermocoleostomius sinensis]|uniref:Lipid-A-disaccharide synthase n=1 Tax=Thermocoleostomius sinensis A174 TaxID=2016057 RepID=A0A9E8ZFU8_9CYAN|nr:lipid-A-disaccharide synthase [Thermocoleostomius sinensis]WAL62635.1 lipid-A-disaccharide synthase [Thermocoleostomius sinensis A174]
MNPIDILLLSNGPGEITTWVRPVVRAIRQQMGNDRRCVRISLILSPCPNASGREVEIAQSYPEIDRIQAARHFFPFLLWGKTADSWDWRDRGVVVFLGGDQIYPVIIGKRLGYRIVVYGEWETRWHRWVDRFGVMKPELIDRVPQQYAHKLSVVGDLMADVEIGGWEDGGWGAKEDRGDGEENTPVPLHPLSLIPHPSDSLIALLPGSKPAKLAQGVPFGLAILQQIYHRRPNTRFVIPVAPTLDLATLAKFADATQNPIASKFGNVTATIDREGDRVYLKTTDGLRVDLWLKFPAYDLLSRCALCLTTVGANTAELGALAVPMIVLIPTQQLDAMRAWDGIPGLLANLPGVGSGFAKLINWWFLRKPRLLAWPNIWAGEAIVPELIGELQPQLVAALALEWLSHPDELAEIRKRLRQTRGQAGAAQRLAQLVQSQAYR